MEPWLRPEEALVGEDSSRWQREDLRKSLEQALFWLRTHLESTPEEALWWEPAPGVPSIGARVHHVIRSSQRLAAYGFEADLDPEALAAEAAQDWAPPRQSKAELLAQLETTFARLQQQLQQAEELQRLCMIGRRRIPVRLSTLLHHIAEHAAYHAGQLILVLRLWQAHQQGASHG